MKKSLFFFIIKESNEKGGIALLKNTVTLVATDLDGTLLNGKKEVTQENREAIHKLKENGILFGIASGRPIETVRAMVKGWGLDKDVSFIMGMNGGAIYDVRRREKEDFHLLEGETVIDIMRFFEDLDVIFQVLVGADRYVSKSTEETRAHAKLYGENEILVDLYAFLENRMVNKIILYCDPSYMPTVLERAKQYKNEECVGFMTANNLFEYVDPIINKGYGICKLCKHFGCSLDHVVAFGDEANDLDMLLVSGMGVAMKNACEEAKKIANVVSPYTNEENAIAHFIEDYILEEA